jgi:hypothetical protein
LKNEIKKLLLNQTVFFGLPVALEPLGRLAGLNMFITGQTQGATGGTANL